MVEGGVQKRYESRKAKGWGEEEKESQQTQHNVYVKIEPERALKV